ncbi:transposase, partial [Escherichia coli]|uniref:transposase n=1 Tax=Escherichia coli TaxID=562 RepID=UPI003D89C307
THNHPPMLPLVSWAWRGVYETGEGEWKVKKHGQERRRIWRKLHLAVDSKTHEIICADLSLNNVTDSEA